jgi:hypothetical protein
LKKRRVLRIEQLEARETPDVSLGHAGAAYSLPSLPANAAVLSGHLQLPPDLLPGSEQTYSSTEALLDPAHQSEAVSYVQALERLFNGADFHQLADDPLSADTQAIKPEQPTDASVSPAKPQLDGDHPLAKDQALQAWQFLSNYTRKAIRNEEMKYGGLADHEDIIHQTFLEWREQVGQESTQLAKLLNKTSPERQVLQKTVRKVIDQTRYQQNRQKKMVELIDQPAPLQRSQQDWTDMRLDWASGVGNLVPQERRLLELRSQGKTFEEIGSEFGIVKQRVCEIYNSTLDRLQTIYAS